MHASWLYYYNNRACGKRLMHKSQRRSDCSSVLVWGRVSLRGVCFLGERESFRYFLRQDLGIRVRFCFCMMVYLGRYAARQTCVFDAIQQQSTSTSSTTIYDSVL